MRSRLGTGTHLLWMTPEPAEGGGRFPRTTHPWRNPMHGRPRLKSHVRPLRRGPGSLQLGVCRDNGMVLEGLSDAEIAVVEGLDGSLDTRTLYASAAAAGVDAGRLSALIATLDEPRLLVHATTDRAHLSPIDEPRRRLLQSDAAAVAAAYGLAGDGFDPVAASSGQQVGIS